MLAVRGRQFVESEGKEMFENNQYPPSFYYPIIERTLNMIREPDVSTEERGGYRGAIQGKITENFERELKYINAPCKTITYNGGSGVSFSKSNHCF